MYCSFVYVNGNPPGRFRFKNFHQLAIFTSAVCIINKYTYIISESLLISSVSLYGTAHDIYFAYDVSIISAKRKGFASPLKNPGFLKL